MLKDGQQVWEDICKMGECEGEEQGEDGGGE